MRISEQKYLWLNSSFSFEEIESKTINSDLGTVEEFEKLIRVAKQDYGIWVLAKLDLATTFQILRTGTVRIAPGVVKPILPIKPTRQFIDWLAENGIAGFSIVVSDSDMEEYAEGIIKELFSETRADLYLLAEVSDATHKAVRYYFDNTPVNAVVNTSLIEDAVREDGVERFINAIHEFWVSDPDSYVHITESHNTLRFPTVAKINNKDALDILFGMIAGRRFFLPHTIVVYQGQELGLKKPMSDVELKKPMQGFMETYRKQEKDGSSCLAYFEKLAWKWFLDYIGA